MQKLFSFSFNKSPRVLIKFQHKLIFFYIANLIDVLIINYYKRKYCNRFKYLTSDP